MSLEPHDPEEFDGSSAAPETVPAAFTTRLSHGKRGLRIVSGFIFGQGAAQGINLLASLFLVRRLSIEAYAQFGLVSGLQTTFSVLMDLGFASTIVPLVGDRTDDPAVVGRYVRSAKHLRDRSFLILAPVAAVVSLAIMHKHHWSWIVQSLLLASVLLSLFSSGMVSCFSAPLFVFGRLREFYLPQVLSGAGRLLAYLVLSLAGGLNAVTAALFSALNITVNGSSFRKSSRKYMQWPEREDPAVDRQLLRYILPATPAIVFSGFQSQISLFLVSLFGSTLYIAEVAALGRIGQFFIVLISFHTIVVEPRIARLSQDRLLRSFIAFSLLAAAACAPVVLMAFRWPEVFLWILGPRFKGVLQPMGWYVLSMSMNFVSSLIWIMNRARKWVFWSGSILEVVLLLVVQVLFLAFIGVRSTQQAVFFMLASSACYMVAHIYVSMRGFLMKQQVP